MAPAIHKRRVSPGKTFAHWLVACAVGEAVGLTLSGVVGAVVAPAIAHHGEAALSALMLAAGALEGACIGLAQGLVLRRLLPRISLLAFVGATAGGFALGWLWGAAMTLYEPEGQTIVQVLQVAIGSGVGLGLAVGTLQALVLRGRSNGLPAWVAATTAAWGLGMVVSYFGASAVPHGEWRASMIFIGLGTGTAVGLVVGAVTALPLLRLRPSS